MGGGIPPLPTTQASHTLLQNGSELIHVEDPHYPLVIIRFYIPAGNAYDFDWMPGLSLLTSAMLLEGSAGKSSQEIAEILDRQGVILNISSEREWLVVAALVLREQLETFLPILATILLYPNFDETEFEKQRALSFSRLQKNRANPEYLAAEQLTRTLFPNHPYSFYNVDEQTLNQVTIEDLVAFYQKFVRPNGTLIGISGQIALEEARTLLEIHFKDWKPREAKSPSFPKVTQPDGMRIQVIERPHSEQVTLLLGHPSITLVHPDMLALELFNRMVGGNVTGRLFNTLREELGWTYSINSVLSHARHGGSFSLHSSLKRDKIRESMDRMGALIHDLQHGSIQMEEVQAAKDSYAGSFTLSFENPETPVNLLLRQRIFGLADDYYHQYPQKIYDTTPERIQQAGRTHIHPAQAYVVLVGDPKDFLDSINDLGTVEHFMLGDTGIIPARNV